MENKWKKSVKKIHLFSNRKSDNSKIFLNGFKQEKGLFLS